MRKTLLAVAVGAAVSLSACNDANNSSNTENQATAEKSSQEATTMNPFFKPSPLQYHAPDFDAIQFKHFEPAFEKGMKEHMAEIEAIANNTEKPTFENTIVAMEKSGVILNRVSSVFYNLASSNSNEDIRELRGELAPKLAKHSDNIRLNAKLFDRISDLYERRSDLGLNAVSERLLEQTYKNFVRSGAKLTDAEQQKIREINSELSSLTTQFNSDLMALTQENIVYIDSKDKLKGLSDQHIQTLADAAEERGHSGEYAIILTNTTRQAILASLDNREVRKQVWEASANRGAGTTETDTRPLIKKLTKLRAEKADLLGYKSWADYTLENNVAGDPEKAKSMLQDLVPAVVSNVEKEAEEIRSLMTKEGQDHELKPWDWLYYAEKVRAEKYAIDSDEVKPYFELKSVLENGVFFAMNQLFGISFEKRDDIPTYHPDVLVYEVKDKDGSSIGFFYGDYFARDGKRGGAWMNSFRSQSHLFDQKPVIVNNLNITKAPEGEPNLLTFDEVSTMFHEMGHAVHGLFSDVKYPSQAGTSVPRDFVEFPSTFEEDWALDPKVLANYAKHYKTGEQIPQELLDKVLAARNFNQGYDTLEYMAAALLDLEYHSIEAGTEIDNVLSFEEDALEKNGVNVEAVPPRYRSTYFSHIFAGGYSAGYYVYLWSEIFAADAFKHMANNGGLTLENGSGFREHILSKGSSKAPMQLYIDWRGQEPTVDALLERRGLSSTD